MSGCKQTSKQANQQTNKQTSKQTNKQTKKQRKKETNKQTGTTNIQNSCANNDEHIAQGSVNTYNHQLSRAFQLMHA